MPTRSSGHPTSALGFATRAVWTGGEPCPLTGATVAPIYLSSTFTLPEVGQTKGYDYSRTGNPTRARLEAQLAELESARYAAAFASGMAAIAGVTALLSPGDHIVAGRDLYGGTHRLFVAVLARYGIETTFVDATDPGLVAAALRPNSRLIWLETPSNPTLRLVDIAAVAAIKGACLLAVDNTFASPYFQQPIALGADLVVHSTTKYLSGHSDVLGGVAITDDPELHARIAFHQNAVGSVAGPWDAYLVQRGAKSLRLRMEAHASNAQAVAEFLAGHPDVAEVLYPGLPSHPQHALAVRQMSGFGGIVSFRPHGGAARARAIAQATDLFALAVSLGGVESLICSPASMTHASLDACERAALGVADDLLRLSVGIEDVGDLVADLSRSFERVPLGIFGPSWYIGGLGNRSRLSSQVLGESIPKLKPNSEESSLPHVPR